MQAGKNAMESVKEKVANVGASAKAGLDKTKATIEEKVEKATAQHPAEKQMAEQKKQLKILEAEVVKQERKAHNAAIREHARNAHNQSSQAPAGTETAGLIGGHVEEGMTLSRPVASVPGLSRPSAAHGPEVETGYPEGHGTGPYPV